MSQSIDIVSSSISLKEQRYNLTKNARWGARGIDHIVKNVFRLVSERRSATAKAPPQTGSDLFGLHRQERKREQAGLTVIRLRKNWQLEKLRRSNRDSIKATEPRESLTIESR